MEYLSLREEDEQLLLHLHDFIYLDKQFITDYIYTSYINKLSVYRRLSALKNAGYIKVFLRQIDNTDHRPSNLYTLTKFGVDTVEQMRGVSHWRQEWTADTPVWWRHTLMIAYAVKQFEIHAEKHGLIFHEWIPEPRAAFEYPTINTAKSKTSIRPDGILVIGTEGSTERMGIFIEMERSYSTRERTIRKIDQFNEFLSRRDELMDDYQYKVAFNEPVTSWVILFIGATEAKTNKILRDISNVNTTLPVLVACKEDIHEDPYDSIYRDTRHPDTYTTL